MNVRRVALSGFAAGRLLALLAVTLGSLPAGAAVPVIVNSSSSSWLESAAVNDTADGRTVTVTLIIKHDVGRSVTALKIDEDYDGSDNSASAPSRAVTAQTLPGGFNYSRVTFSYSAAIPASFSCPIVGTKIRKVDVPLRVRARLDNGDETTAVSGTLHFVTSGNCTGADDMPYVYAQSQDLASTAPGGTVVFTFTADDADSSGPDNSAADLSWRVRNLNTGAVSLETIRSAGDNVARTISVTFTHRGRFIVEGRIRSELNNFTDPASYFRLGGVDVNSAAPPTVSLSAPGMVDVGAPATAIAIFSDVDAADAGLVQFLEWDADNDGAFERRALADPESSGLSAVQRQQSVDTSAFGLRVLRARGVDNGAMNAADNIRRTSAIATATVVVNAVPIATDQSIAIDEDTPRALLLSASDADNQPSPLAYAAGPAAHGTLLCNPAGSCMYTPAANYNGPDAFTFTATDGFATSAIATVTIDVAAVNDAPVADDISAATNEDTPVAFTLTASDPDSAFTFIVPATSAHGIVSCTGANCLYSPAQDYHGADSFTINARDSVGGADGPPAAVAIAIAAVNDPPVAGDVAISTTEDLAATFTPPASDVDVEPLTLSISSGPAHGGASCAGTVCTYTPAPGYFGPDSFVYIAMDAANASDSGTVSVTVVERDREPPVVTCPAPIAVNTDPGLCSASVSAAATAVDAFDGVIVPVCTRSDLAAMGSPFARGVTTVSCSATDAAGNSASCSFTVTVTDAQPPSITAPPPLTTGTNSGCSYAGTIGSPVASDNCSGLSVTNNAPASFPVGTTTVTWTVTDLAGNAATATQLITVTDDDAPSITAPAAVTLGTNSGCAYAGSIGSATGFDNCSPAVITSNAPATFPLGATTVTWTATDAAGNFATATQLVTIVDSTAPSITPPAAITTGTNSGCVYTGAIGTATATDNCSTPVVTSNAPATFPIGSTTVTWTATDAAGNTNTATQVVTVADDDAPTITAPPPFSVGTNSGCAYSGAIGAPTVSDACSGVSVINNAPASFPVGATTVTWTVTDLAGNAATATQIITVTDDDAPSITAPAAVTLGTNSGCAYAGLIGSATGFDNCSPAVITSNAPATFPLGATTVTWTATDAAGNFATATQLVTIVDSTPPSITPPAAITTGTNSGCVYTGAIGTATATDNCSTPVVTSNAPATFPIGSTTVTWTATDAAGNTNTATQVVTVADDDAPTITAPPPFSVGTNGGCAYSGAIGAPTVSDACSSVSVINNAPASFPVGATTVTWTVTDLAGNAATATQLITVTDDDAPSITAPAAVTLGTNSGCAYAGSIGSATGFDNCSPVVITSNAPATFPLGATTVTWTATDAAGNFATATQLVTIVDSTPPSITPPAAISTGTNSGCVYTGAIGTATATDNCSTPVVTSNAPATFPIGSTTVTWTATDAAGNANSATQVVTVADDDAPLITAPAAFIITIPGGHYTGSIGVATATDNCSTAVISNNAPPSFPLGATTVTWTATDAAGNTASATQIVTVMDIPVITVTMVSATISIGEGGGHVSVQIRVSTADDSATGAPSSVHYATADGTASAGSDYTAISANLPIPVATPSGTILTVDVPITPDDWYELDEQFLITLSSPSTATLGALTSTAITVANDDAPPRFKVSDVSRYEGNAGTTSFTFVVTKTGLTALNATVDVATANGTATSADYTPLPATTLLFAAAETAKNVTVEIAGDAMVEADETFDVVLSNATLATIGGGIGHGTIRNDDASGVTVVGASLHTSESGAADTFSVVLDSQPAGAVVIDVTSGDPSEVAVSPARLTFTGADWNSAQSVTVTGVADSDADGPQSVLIALTINAALTTDVGYLSVHPGSVAVVNADESAVLYLSKTLAPEQPLHVLVGDTISYVIVTRNDGSSAQNVTLIDTFPANSEVASANPGQGTCGPGAGTVVCDLGSLAPAQEVTTSLVLRITAPGSFINQAAVTSPLGGAASAAAASVTATATAAGIPALDEWMLILLAALIASVAIFRMRLGS